MRRFNLQRGAGLAAFLGGIFQATLLFLQFNKLGQVIQGGYHITWDWDIPREYRWILVSPWLFFLIALLCLYWYVEPRLHRPLWRGTLAIVLPLMTIILPEIVQAFLSNCVPDLPCDPGNRLMPLFLISVSIVGVISLSASLLFLGKSLIEAVLPRVQVFVRFFVVLLFVHTCLVAVEVGEWVPGYFKIDILSIALGLILAAAWCLIGCVLCLKALPPLEEMRHMRG